MSMSFAARPAYQRLLTREALTSDTAWLVYIALASFIAHMIVAGNYGYFRDELYYVCHQPKLPLADLWKRAKHFN